MNDLYSCITNLMNRYLDKEGLLIDVGAYHGNFTKEMLETGKFDQAILFEPNPINTKVLDNIYGADSKITILPLAVGNKPATVKFHYNKDYATGSVLPYKNLQEELTTVNIQQVKLDDVINVERINLIKIDAQGADLRVLEGAEQLLFNHRPFVITELMFVPYYEKQDSPYQVVNWLTQRDYKLAGVFNEHYTREGILAFSDVVFIPQEIQKNATIDDFFAKPDIINLTRENVLFKAVCDERLGLINLLQAVCDERLKLINFLDSELKKNRMGIKRTFDCFRRSVGTGEKNSESSSS